jgi:Protein of unknown function DUF262/Protein of unknown function (DUF1524)
MASARYEVVSSTVEQLFASGSSSFRVPPFQRGYAWGKEEVSQLLDDFFGPGSDEQLPYFLGSLVLAKDANEPDGALLVLDGQQRLTTLALVLAALIHALREMGHDRASEWLGYLFTSPVMGPRTLKIRLQIEDACRYEPLVQGEEPPNPAMRHNVDRAATVVQDYLSEQFSRLEGESGIEAKQTVCLRLLQRVLNSVELVKITAPSEGDAFKLFETLNDRGLALSAADLVKNKLFAQCGDEIDEVSASWANMIATTQSEDVVSFLRYYWMATKGFVRRSGLYDAYRSHLQGMEKTAAAMFALDLEDAAKSYRSVVEPRVVRAEIQTQRGTLANSFVNDSVLAMLERLLVFRARSCRTVLLGAMISRPELLDAITRLCQSVTVRYSVIGQRNPNLLERLYAEACERVRRTSTEYIDVADIFMDDIPSDSDFSELLRDSDWMSPNATKRELLVAMNEQASDGEVELAGSSRVHVDHILPKSLRASALREGGMSQHEGKELVGRLGNVTLLSGRRNRELSDGPFSKKRAVFSNSDIAITRRLASHENWTSDRIAERTEELIKLAIVAFPHPAALAQTVKIPGCCGGPS